MNDRRVLEQLVEKRSNDGPVRPLEVDMDKLADHIADVTKKVCDALVKRGFNEEAAVFLAARIVPNLM